MTRIEKEKQTINLMINIYCRKKHKHKMDYVKIAKNY